MHKQSSCRNYETEKGRKVTDFGVEKGIIRVLEKGESSWAKDNERGRGGLYIHLCQVPIIESGNMKRPDSSHVR